MEANAVAQQIEEIARSIAQDKNAIQQEDRTRALSALVELKRMEQLRAIAGSKNNTTYFFGDKAALGHGPDPYNIDYAEQIKSGLEKRPKGAESVI